MRMTRNAFPSAKKGRGAISNVLLWIDFDNFAFCVVTNRSQTLL